MPEVANIYDHKLNAMTTIPRRIHANTANMQLLHTQAPTLGDKKTRFNVLEQLLKNHLTPFIVKIAEIAKLQYDQSLLQDAEELIKLATSTIEPTL